VTDCGVDQNIKIYDPSNLLGAPTHPVSSFGVVGGIHQGIDGQTGPQRLFDPCGIGADSRGNIYVANSIPNGSGPGISLESYRPDGTTNWSSPLQCLEFVNCANADPVSDTNVYSTTKHYAFDYTKPPGKGWKLKSLTLDRFRFPDDPRLHREFCGGVWVRWINGQKYLFLTEQMGHEIAVYRFDSKSAGETAIPYAFVSDGWIEQGTEHWPAGEPGSKDHSVDWIWCDANGNARIDPSEFATSVGNPGVTYDPGWGLYVDTSGGIWQSGHGHVRHFNLRLDKVGRPEWNYSKENCSLFDPPQLPGGAQWKHGANGDNDDMDRIVYVPASDTLYVSGFTTDYPDDSGAWGTCGRVIYRYDHWSGAKSIHPGYPVQLSWGSKGDASVKSLCVEGDYIFAVEGREPETVTVYDVRTGKTAGTMTPDASVGHHSGWVDANYAIAAHKRASGGYVVFVEEDACEKTLMYRWMPTRQEQDPKGR
jgi:hypothetical protein